MNFDDLIERIADRIVDRLRPAPPAAKPKPAAPPRRELTPLEQVQKDFAFLEEQGGVMQFDLQTGELRPFRRSRW